MTAVSQTSSSGARLPQHIAIIMDGNGRWARARGLPRIAGHRQGAEAVRRAVVSCIELGVDFLTVYAFSSENWKRPEREINDLIGLLGAYLRNEIAELAARGVRVRFIGDRERFAPEIRKLIDAAETSTSTKKALTLTVALNYGGRHEILRATRRIAEDAAAGRIEPAKIDEGMFSAYLDTHAIPDPDLVIRTSGEQRLSNFLLWQAAYAELVFLPTLWPDFKKEDLEFAIAEFGRRDRRFGGSHG